MPPSPDTLEAQHCRGAALLILGVRHRKLKTEIWKTLEKWDGFENPVKWFIAELPKDWIHTFIGVFHTPERAYKAWAESQQKNYATFAPRYHLPPAFRYDSPEEVPVDLAYSFMVNIPGGVVDSPKFCVDALGFVPWLARVEADQLFLPHEFMEANRVTLRPEHVLSTLKRRDAVYGANEPIRRTQEKVGRNDPCPCGSGQKYKKCCQGKKRPA